MTDLSSTVRRIAGHVVRVDSFFFRFGPLADPGAVAGPELLEFGVILRTVNENVIQSAVPVATDGRRAQDGNTSTERPRSIGHNHLSLIVFPV